MRMSRKHMVGRVDRRGQWKRSICDARGPCQMIWSIMKSVFRRLWRICCTYESLRCLDVQIWRFLCWQTDWQTDRTDYFTPCACARGNYITETQCLSNTYLSYQQLWATHAHHSPILCVCCWVLSHIHSCLGHTKKITCLSGPPASDFSPRVCLLFASWYTFSGKGRHIHI
jgi:hypothetical protein